MITHYTKTEGAKKSPLDLFSTSPTRTWASPICSYAAPYFAYEITPKTWGVAQGCCNHWDCSRCGIIRAKQEYGRIVSGCEKLAKEHDLFFLTITCKGKGLSHEEAEQKYLVWTNRLLDACRAKWKRQGREWYYVQVTERQKRGHPHSHILTNFVPHDMFEGTKEQWAMDRLGNRVKDLKTAWRSNWLAKQVVRSGLGEQYDISPVESAAAASRYVAKYMFKPTMFSTDWPKGWKRVRYSQSFPKLEPVKSNAMVLLDWRDWQELAGHAAVVVVKADTDILHVDKHLAGNDVIIVNKTPSGKVKF